MNLAGKRSFGIGLMLAIGICVVLQSGCQQWPWQKQNTAAPVVDPVNPSDAYVAPAPAPAGLQLSSQCRFKDVPLPMNVKEDNERTFVFESSALQVGRLVYTSRANISELTQFYIQEAPTAQWQLQEVLEAQAKTLVFTKPGKHLTVMVQDLGLPQGRRLTLTLTPAN